MKYLSYDRYKELGGILEESAFNLLESRAEHKLDYITNNKLKEEETSIPSQVEELMLSYINLLEYTNTTNNLSSYSNGVESFGYNQRTTQETNAEFTTLAKEYLAGTDLLYRGGVKFENI